MIDATTLFSQAGYEIKDSLDLGKQAIILKNVSEAGATASESAQTLISTLKGFSDEGLNATHVVDALNKVSNSYATSVNDLSAGIKRASAAMAAGGNSFEETLGLLTSGIEIMQQPGKVANALSTISARLTASNDAYIASITGGMGTVDDYTGELRSTYDILKDLAEVYPTLSSTERQNMIEVVASKTQRTALTSILENFDHAIGATEAALNSEGSAAEENAKRMDSLNGKLTKLQSAWQSLARDTINSDFVKTLLDIATALVKITDNVGGLVPTITAITGALVVLEARKIGDKITAFGENLTSIKNGFKILKQHILGAKDATVIYMDATTKAATSAELFSLAMGSIVAVTSLVVMGINAVISAQEDFRKASLESANSHLEEASSYNEKISVEEKAIENLEKEKTALENVANTDDGTKDKTEQKQKEIQARKDNIDKMKQEQKEAAALALGDVSGRKGSTDFFGGTLSEGFGFFGVETEERKKVVSSLQDINTELATATTNSGKYNRILEEQKKKYSDLLLQQKSNNEDYSVTEKVLKKLSKEQSRISENYEKDAELAKVYYNALKNGISEVEAGQDMVDWMQEFYGLTEEQMTQLEEGNDVLNDSKNAIDSYTEAISKLEQQATSYESIVTGNIQQIKDYQTNVDLLVQANQELASSTGLTADTFLQLQSAGLLQYLTEVNGKVQANTEDFKNNAQTLIAGAEAALKNEWAQEQMQLVLAASNNTLDDQAKKLGLVNTESSKFDKTKTITQLQQEAMTLVAGTESWNAYYKSMGGEDVNLNLENIKAQQDKLQDYLNQTTKNFEARVKAINSIKLDTTPKKSSTKKTTKKTTKEEYKATIDTLYKYENALDNAKEEVNRLSDAVGNTDNYEEQVKYINQLIEALNNQIAKTNDLKNAQANQIRDYINQLRNQGFAIDYNSDKNELLINNMEHLADFSGDTAKSLEKIINKIQSLNDNNRTLDNSVRSLTSNVKKYYDQLADIPEEKLKKFNELMEDFQQSQLDAVQDQITDIEEAMKKDPRLEALEKQIEALEKQNDTIDKQKEMEEKLLAVEEARQKLENQRKQKTLQVYSEEARRMDVGE